MIRRAATREEFVENQLARRGITDPAVLAAFRAVPREAFLPPEMAEFAYNDTALPIEKGQTISQPYIVGLMTEALGLKPSDRVLEVGTGSGYAAAILGKVAREVYTIERHAELAEQAAERLTAQGFDNVHVMVGDGTLGWGEHAPYDAICVAAGGPAAPQALLAQLDIGGRLVIPVGEDKDLQKLVRIVRVGANEYRTEELCDVRFVPLIGAAGWQDAESVPRPTPRVSPSPRTGAQLIAELIRETAEPCGEITSDACGPVVERAAGSRLVLIGEATHGTSEFYRIRAEITRRLIEREGFAFVAVEADWPDAARIDDYVRGRTPANGRAWEAFARFPAWMWRNREVLDFVEWLRRHNLAIDDPARRVGFYGLDLYSMYTSIRAVLEYLERIDPAAAETARLRYGCLTPWEGDPALYGRLAVGGRYRVCEPEAVAVVTDLLKQRLEYRDYDAARFLDAVQNARLVANAERYYRAMYYGGHESWNLRDEHMFETLELLLGFHGPRSRGVLWEHNSHLGDATATDMGARGEINVGHLCRQKFGPAAYLIGQGTDHGTVAAASNWDEPMQIKQVRPAHPRSFESLFHESRLGAGFLPLRHARREDIRAELDAPRLERAIGVVYRPETELASHYFHARLASQFDEYIWFDRTQALHALAASEARGLAPAHPFAVK